MERPKRIFLLFLQLSEAPTDHGSWALVAVLHFPVVGLQTIVLLIAVERPVPPPAVTVLRLGSLADDVVECILKMTHQFVSFWSSFSLTPFMVCYQAFSLRFNSESGVELPSIGSCFPLIR